MIFIWDFRPAAHPVWRGYFWMWNDFSLRHKMNDQSSRHHQDKETGQGNDYRFAHNGLAHRARHGTCSSCNASRAIAPLLMSPPRSLHSSDASKENSPGAAVPASFPLSPEDFDVMSTSVNQRRSLAIAQFHELRLDDRCPSTRKYFRMKLPSRPAIIQSVQTHRVKNRK
jgi:hypothetical protein